MKKLGDLTDPAAVQAALAEFDDLGRDAFLAKYGFKPAKRYFLVRSGQRYDSKAIAAAAVGIQFPADGPLLAENFSGGDATVKTRLKRLDFEVEVLEAAKRNPDWTREETILALDLLIRRRPTLPDQLDDDVIELSTLLKRYAAQRGVRGNDRFRNPDGVSMKVSNLSRLDPADEREGLPHGSKTIEPQVWAEFMPDTAKLHAAAEAIRAQILAGPIGPDAATSSQTRTSTKLTVFNAVESSSRVRRAFRRWREALETKRSHLPRSVVWLVDPGLLIHFWQRDARQMARLRTALDGENFAVEINEPTDPTCHNGTSAIAVGSDKRTYLLREGRLNDPGGSRVDATTFSEATGRTGVVLDFVRGRSDRAWHVVACLDEPGIVIRQQTAAFVADCKLARGWSAMPLEDRKTVENLRAIEEQGGGYLIGEKPAAPPRWVDQLHAKVSKALLARLKADGRDLGSISRIGGYCVDGAITTKARHLLLEIKTTAKAADVHGGMGQLLLYRRLFPQFEAHVPVLLLRGRPTDLLSKAVEDCGVRLMSYEVEGEGEPKVIFGDDFLALCDLAVGDHT